MTRRLYDIAGDVLALEELLLESGGEWTPEAEALFAEVEGSLESKCDAYAALIREWELDAEKWKAEEQRCAAHRKTRENAAARLKARLVDALVTIGRDKVEGERFKVAVQRSAATAEVVANVELLPAEMVRVVPESRVADKGRILAALKAGNGDLLDDSGTVLATLRPGTPYLRIR